MMKTNKAVDIGMLGMLKPKHRQKSRKVELFEQGQSIANQIVSPESPGPVVEFSLTIDKFYSGSSQMDDKPKPGAHYDAEPLTNTGNFGSKKDELEFEFQRMMIRDEEEMTFSMLSGALFWESVIADSIDSTFALESTTTCSGQLDSSNKLPQYDILEFKHSNKRSKTVKIAHGKKVKFSSTDEMVGASLTEPIPSPVAVNIRPKARRRKNKANKSMQENLGRN